MNTQWLSKSGLLLGWILALTPVLLWAISGSLNYNSIWSVFHILGQACGILAFSFFGINMILAARYPWVEYLFSGLDKVYKAHHKWGAYGFGFMILHPVFLALRYLGVSPSASYEFLMGGFSDFAVMWGRLAMFTIFIILFVTLYVKTKYEHWRSLHQWIGVGVIFASIHVYVIPSTTATYTPLRYYMVALMCSAIASWFYTTVFRKFGFKQYQYTVTNVVRKGVVTEIELASEKKLLFHKPGQFGFFTFAQSGIEKKPHPFTFTSVGNTGTISIAVKDLGDFSHSLQQLNTGSSVHVEGPYGTFGQVDDAHASNIWIAGGIGITPFISLAKNFNNKSQQTSLWYSVRNHSEAIYVDEFRSLAKQYSNFKFYLIETDSTGYLTIDRIAQETNLSGSELFFCGNKPLIDSLKNQLTTRSEKVATIHEEEFALI